MLLSIKTCHFSSHLHLQIIKPRQSFLLLETEPISKVFHTFPRELQRTAFPTHTNVNMVKQSKANILHMTFSNSNQFFFSNKSTDGSLKKQLFSNTYNSCTSEEYLGGNYFCAKSSLEDNATTCDRKLDNIL